MCYTLRHSIAPYILGFGDFFPPVLLISILSSPPRFTLYPTPPSRTRQSCEPPTRYPSLSFTMLLIKLNKNVHAYWYMCILIGFDLFGWDFSPLLASHTAHPRRQRDSTHMAWTLSPDSTHPTNGEAGPERGIEKRGQVPCHRPLTSHWGVVGWAWTGQEAEILVICSQNNHWNGLHLAKKTQVLLLGIINFFFPAPGWMEILKSKVIEKTSVPCSLPLNSNS